MRRWIVAAALLLLVPTWPVHAASDDDPPNVVLIISDDQAWTDFGFMGHEHIRTPHLDELASESLTYTRGYVPDSLCRPSLATMVTGLYPHQHGIVSNDPTPKMKEPLRKELTRKIDQVPTLPRLLGSRGYLSHQSGKWWEGHYERGGFTHGMTRGFTNHPEGRHGDEGLKIGREGMGPVFRFMDTARKRNRPFFLWYAPFMPHRPHTPPDRLLNHYKELTDSKHVARYWAMCEWFDRTCGKLLGYLDEHGLAQNTIVVFVTDNGWIQQRDGSGYAPRSKRTPFEAGIRTPIMVRWPGRVEPRMDRTTPVSSIDIAPTVLRACGLRPTAAMPGIDLRDRDRLAEREAIFGATYYHNHRDLDRPAASLKHRWVISDGSKLILPHEPNLGDEPTRLYDLDSDPHEKHNLAERNPQRVQQLRGRIERWWPVR